MKIGTELDKIRRSVRMNSDCGELVADDASANEEERE
jgi:hypothetical protein